LNTRALVGIVKLAMLLHLINCRFIIIIIIIICLKFHKSSLLLTANIAAFIHLSNRRQLVLDIVTASEAYLQ